MPHPCHNNWMNPTVNVVVALRDHVVAQTDAQHAAGCTVGAWAYFLPLFKDFDAFRKCFVSLGRALDTPTNPPGEWTGGPIPPPNPPYDDLVNMQPIGSEYSESLRLKSRDVSQVLGLDEFGVLGSPPLPVHPLQGMPGWLSSGAFNPLAKAQAEDLFTAMRHALDR